MFIPLIYAGAFVVFSLGLLALIEVVKEIYALWCSYKQTGRYQINFYNYRRALEKAAKESGYAEKCLEEARKECGE